MRRFAISDVHGCPRTLRRLVEENLKLRPSDHLYLLGDYVNRGPDSLGVIDQIHQWQDTGYQITCLKGNHEERVEKAVEAGNFSLEEKYCQFIKGLKIYQEVEGYILVHAGMNFKETNPYEDEHAMVWIRGDWEENIDLQWMKGRKIVHGHKRRKRKEIEAFPASSQAYIGIDNGCCLNDTVEGEGSLCALELGSEILTFQPNLDMNPGEGQKEWTYLFEYQC